MPSIEQQQQTKTNYNTNFEEQEQTNVKYNTKH
jgi:hypothetical protein